MLYWVREFTFVFTETLWNEQSNLWDSNHFRDQIFWSMLTLFNGCPGPCRGGFVFKNFEMGTLNGGRYI